MNLVRYWIEFEISPGELTMYPSYAGLAYGCGVTAPSYEEAVDTLVEKLFRKDPIPEIKTVIENVDLSALDAGHVLPNIGNPVVRGIWFPAGIR